MFHAHLQVPILFIALYAAYLIYELCIQFQRLLYNNPQCIEMIIFFLVYYNLTNGYCIYSNHIYCLKLRHEMAGNYSANII